MVADHLGFELTDASPSLLKDCPIIEQFGGDEAKTAQALGRVGLADAYTWCRTPSELSVGQRARLRLAVALENSGPLIVHDEWLAYLDRTTAKAVAWATGKALRRAGKSAIVVTAHADIAADLAPDTLVEVGWTPEPKISHTTSPLHRCSIVDRIKYRRADSSDWQKLKHLHYIAGDPATIHSYHALTLPGNDCPVAVALLSYPELHSAARNLATQDAYRIKGNRQAAQRLNREVLKLSRMVVTPELRGCGLAGDLIEQIAANTTVRYIECVTAMGRYSRFLERVGFREVPQTSAPQEAKLLDWAVRHQVPPSVCLDPAELAAWVDDQSVRVRREGRRLVWLYFHHFVLHRRTRKAPPSRIPGPNDPRWSEAWQMVAGRMHDRPVYHILGPLDPMTRCIDEADRPAAMLEN